MSSKNLVLYFLFVAAFSVSLLPHSATAGVKCLDVELKIASCLPYISNGGEPSMSCCDGVSSLKNEYGNSKSDLREACKCLKKMAKNISPEEAEHAKDLPDLCHVNIPYPISLKTDCNKIK